MKRIGCKTTIFWSLKALYLLTLIVVIFLIFINSFTQLYCIFENLSQEYAVNCSQITAARLWSHLDVFAFGHFWGWALKALLVRHYGICWTISVMWEVTEVCWLRFWLKFVIQWWYVCTKSKQVCIKNLPHSVELLHWSTYTNIQVVRSTVCAKYLQEIRQSL